MKKLYLFLVLFIGCFLFGKAQDTIVYKNGKRVVGKVVSVGKVKVTYTVPPDSTPKFISNWSWIISVTKAAPSIILQE